MLVVKPPVPHDETCRLETLISLDILDTTAEERFDRITRLAKRLFGVSIALVSLVDANRQWFKSKQGLDATETPRDISFCGHAILQDEVFTISDACRDKRFCDNPLVTSEPMIRFYAGCPISARNGSKLGTLCLIDQAPRTLDPEEHRILRDLAGMVEDEIAAIDLATMDDLTGLSNRRGFDLLSKHALATCARLKKPASLLYIDLDRFKDINDQFGHESGDRILRETGQILSSVFRDSDVLARVGGDEFCVLLVGANERDVSFALQRLADAVDARNREPGNVCAISYSVGIACAESDVPASIDDLARAADGEMYKHKFGKRNTA